MFFLREVLTVSHIRQYNLELSERRSVRGVSTDSRTVRPGEVFVALRGEQFDGHDYARDVVSRRGAMLAIVDERSVLERGLPNYPAIVVRNTLGALGELAHLYRRKFSIPVLGITGTNGKTTTKEMIALVLGTRFNVLKTEKNLNNQIGVPQTLFRLNKKHNVAVIEMGTNHFGEIASLARIAMPTHGMITNIGRGHIEFLRDARGVAREKGALYSSVAERGGLTYVNMNDKYVPQLAEKAPLVFRYGFNVKNAEVKGKIIGLDRHACAQLQVSAGGKKTVITLPVPGLHVASNALAATAVGVSFGIPLSRAKKALEKFKTVGDRMRVIEHRGVTIIDDVYNANPESMGAALETLRAMKPEGRRIAILGDMKELGTSSARLHREVGRSAAEAKLALLVTVGDDAKLIAASAKRGGVNVQYYQTKREAILAVKKEVKHGDVLLVKASHSAKFEEIVQALTRKA